MYVIICVPCCHSSMFPLYVGDVEFLHGRVTFCSYSEAMHWNDLTAVSDVCCNLMDLGFNVYISEVQK